MSGYYGYSMSNNAVAAYETGLVPASKIKGVPAALVKKYCCATEWHHCSKYFNRVEFFDPLEVRIVFGLEAENDEYEQKPEAMLALQEFKAKKKAAAKK